MAKKNSNFDNDELIAYYTEIYKKIDEETNKDPFGSYVYNRLKGGQKTVLNKTQTEIRNFDMTWLDTIESVYPAITKIMRNPKKALRYETEIVAVEKAKKVNSDTVRHLSSHTQLIKEIKKNGDVIPSKVQTTYAEEELAIYENRFLKSLVRRMELFIERRYEVMKVSLESFETQKLNVVNEFLMSGQQVTVNLDIEIKNDLTVNIETTKEQFNRLCYIRDLVQSLKGTDFMRALAKARDVVPPIMKTNILLHNPDFKLCYGLWLYLDRQDGIATDVDIKEKNYKYSQVFEKDINDVMALAVTAFVRNREIEGIYSSKNLQTVKAPKIERADNVELELNFDADNKKMEDYTMNEALLSETARFFEANMDGMQRSGNTYNESIRVVYRQMLEMLDQIYPKAFGVTDAELDNKDLYQQLEVARRQQMVFKVVKQAKQMNIARMGREEKRLEKQMLDLEKKIKAKEEADRIAAEKEKARIEAEKAAEAERQRVLAEKRKNLEKEAVERQKELLEAKKAQEEAKKASNEKKAEKTNKARDLQAAKRDKIRAERGLNKPEPKPDELDILEENLNETPVEANEVETQATEPETSELEATPEEVVEDTTPEENNENNDEIDDFLNSIPEAEEATEEPVEEEPVTDEIDDFLNSIPEADENGNVVEEQPETDEIDDFLNSIPEAEESNEPKDEYDEMSDEELESLMDENGLFDEDSEFNGEE